MPSVRAAALIWAGLGALVAATFVTYGRLDVEELYHVSRSGVGGGASRALVVVNFPVAIVALVMLPVIVARLLAGPVSGAPRWLIAGAAVASATLCAVTGLPGVVDQGDLDAKPINALPAVGVALALGLTVVAARVARGPAARGAGQRETRVRLILVGVLVILSLPWVFAELGFFVGDVPGLGAVYLSDEYKPADARLPVVHLGHHHGLDGAVFAASALLLMPALAGIGGRGLRPLGTAAVALLFVYGVANLAEDFWGEQVVKRGWTDWHIPQVLRPEITPAWGLIVVVTVVVYIYLGGGRWREHRAATDGGSIGAGRGLTRQG